MIKIIIGSIIIANVVMLWACARAGGKYDC